MTFEELAKANATIKTVSIKGKQYAEVKERIRVFRMLFPNGTISTELISLEDGICIFKATAMNEDGQILATGHAYEKQGSSPINATSFIENCESSAVGRCLGLLGCGIDTSIASYEEVSNAIEQQNQKSTARAARTNSASPAVEQPTEPATKEQQEKFIAFIQEQGLDVTDICKRFNITKKSTPSQLNEVIRRIQVVKIQERSASSTQEGN